MSIPILVEPAANGFRAAAGSPLDLSAEADTAAAAVAALKAKIADRLRSGAFLIEQPVPAPPSPIPVVPLAENPLFDDWLAAVEEYRNSRDAEEQAAEAG
ncbi:MAG TPA: hypothetical protein VKD90_06830 [Gemmataceae bacterium]|nr:hypothetical protein [Gemmataceae bacterium]